MALGINTLARIYEVNRDRKEALCKSFFGNRNRVKDKSNLNNTYSGEYTDMNYIA